MALLETYGNRQQERAYDCPKYAADVSGRRCTHYLKGGSCALADDFMCVEWLKANGRAPPEGHPALVLQQTDLFGLPVPASKSVARKPKLSKPAATSIAAHSVAVPPVDEHNEACALVPIPKENIESFKALGVEVCLTSDELGEVWLVSDSRDASRKEISIEHAATLCLVVGAFPGAKVVSFQKYPSQDKGVDT